MNETEKYNKRCFIERAKEIMRKMIKETNINISENLEKAIISKLTEQYSDGKITQSNIPAEIEKELKTAMTNNMTKTAIIKHLPNGDWQVCDHTGKKNLGKYKSKKKAVERLRQVEYFKNKKSEIANNLLKKAGIKDFTIESVEFNQSNQTSS